MSSIICAAAGEVRLARSPVIGIRDIAEMDRCGRRQRQNEAAKLMPDCR